MMEELKDVIDAMKSETTRLTVDMVDSVRGGKLNKAAGARARKATLNLEKLFKQYRKLSIAAGKE